VNLLQVREMMVKRGEMKMKYFFGDDYTMDYK
jgi:hypothetical protein